MSNENDPFASDPYVPPHRRSDAGAEQGPDASTSAGPDDAEPTVPVPPAGQPEHTTELPRDAVPSDPTPHDSARQDASHDDGTFHRFEDDAAPRREHAPPVAEHPVPTAAAAGAGAAGAGWAVQQAPPARRPRKRRGRRLAGALAVVLLAGAAGFGGAALYGALDDDGPVTVSSLQGEVDAEPAATGQIERVAEAVLPSVTQINVAGAGAAGSGTGIIISDDGEILTNNHVIEAAADGGTITVAFNDGTNGEATILGRDPKTDLAVIKVDGVSGLTPATLGSSASLTVGQEVVAIGSPFGLESTVTSGIVSALNRPVASSDGTGGGSTVFPAVQTDAAINPGNSGGPLVDLQGRVVGINSAIRSGGSAPGEAGSIGLGFAIPVDLARSVAGQLRAGETVEHAQIGVTVRPAVDNDEITGIGAEVVEVNPGSAGADAGLQEGDVITSINDVPVGSSNALVAAIRGYRPGDEVTLSFLRGGERQEVSVTLDSDGGNTA
ncbi:hypothetical protein GCM10009821_09200 [Aeromicrobium halocynthiae]|uniref:PDZ domain-containing protein n=1 Tax=Aeromicrobium halocynthiae TaxID=560557 RepID=A0ABN2VWI7_9ACTN